MGAETTQLERSDVHGNRKIGASFVLFLFGMFGVATIAWLEAESGLQIANAPTLSSRVGVVAATLFCLSSVVCLHRITKNSKKIAFLTALGLTAPAAFWSWRTLATRAMLPTAVLTVLLVVWLVLGVVLLIRGFRRDDWFESFSGLGSLALAATALMDRSWFGGTAASVGVSLLASVSGMACLFGMLVDLELTMETINRNLIKVRSELRHSTQRSDDLMHDLRGGLLSIEAATEIAPGQGSSLLKTEIARLRLLTRRENEQAEHFDLVVPIRDLVNIHRSAGIEIDLRSPKQAVVSGSKSQVLSIVQNLIENAARHGEGMICLIIDSDDQGLRVGVSDEGPGLIGVDKQTIFRRGVTTSRSGHGVGLHVSQRLAKANDADLYYEEDSEGRSRFVLEFVSVRSNQPALAS